MIEFICIVILLSGWAIQINRVLGELRKIKGTKVPLSWYIRNRSSKFWISLIGCLVTGFISFIWFDAGNLVGKELAMYMVTLFGIGMGSNFLADKLGSKMSYIGEDDPDDGKTLIGRLK